MQSEDFLIDRHVKCVAREKSAHRFGKSDKLLQRSEFLALANGGKKIQNELFIAYVAKGKTGHCRLGITVTKKVGHAAVRNRIKRLIREHFRQHRQALGHVLDISLIVKRQAPLFSNTIIVTSLETLFEKIASIQLD